MILIPQEQLVSHFECLAQCQDDLRGQILPLPNISHIFHFMARVDVQSTKFISGHFNWIGVY